MKYKPGDKVKIKSLDWYKSAPKDTDGCVKCGISYFSSAMQEFCGKELTIEHAYGLHYSMVEDVYGWQWDDEMIECLVEPASKMVSLDKVCEWLDSKNRMCMFELEMILGTNFIKEFRKAMEE